MPTPAFALSSAPAQPVDDSIQWLRPSGLIRHRRWLLAALLGPAMMLFVTIFGTHAGHPVQMTYSALALAAIVCVALLPLEYIARHRLGFRGRQLCLRRPDGSIVAGEGAKLALYGRLQLRIGAVLLPIRTPSGNLLWEPALMREQIMPRLAQARRIGAMEALRSTWRTRFLLVLLPMTCMLVLAVANLAWLCTTLFA